MCILCTSLVCCKEKSTLNHTDLVIVKADGTEIGCSVEIAKSEEERNYGFMNRKNIPQGTGMIFVFEKDQMLRFWMKNTPHPLSIAYIDSQGIIKDIYDMTPFSIEGVESTSSVRFALEVPQGWFDSVGIQKGDKVMLKTGDSLKRL